MTQHSLCDSCATINLHNLFLNNYCSFARAYALTNDLEVDPDNDIRANTIVSRQREDILDDREVDAASEQAWLGEFLTEVGYDKERNGDVLSFIEDRLFRPCAQNEFAMCFGRLSEVKARADHCYFCALVLDTRLWRILNTNGEIDAIGSQSNPAVNIAIEEDRHCYLYPTWPYYKSMWHDYFTTPNELCVLLASSEDSLPPDNIDDCLFDRSRELRTLCLVDHPKAIWQSLRPLVDWNQVVKWIPDFSGNSGALDELGPTHSTSYMLIDIATSAIIRVPSLHGLCYAALSYVWGAARTSEKWCQDIQGLHDSGKVYPTTISFASLPATIQDTIIVCCKLHIPFLWVDSLCITQNQLEEKSKAIADMGHIYKASHLCIVAAADGGVHDPLPGVNLERPRSQYTVNGLNVSICPPALRDTVHESKWNSRGWCFQESALAPRCLVILKDQVFLQSGSSIRCESVDFDIGNNYDDLMQDYKEEPLTTLSIYTKDNSQSSFSVYKDMAQNYSRRELSFESDIEDAFQGLLLNLERRYGLTTFRALPTHDLPRSLNWFCVVAQTWNKRALQSRHRLNAAGRPCAPSWTWISRIAQVQFTTIPDVESVTYPDCMTKHGSKWTHLIPAMDLPAEGFETSFATRQSSNNSGRRVLDSALMLETGIYHASQLKVANIDVLVSVWLENYQEHKYILDSGDRSAFEGEPYVLPIAFQRKSARSGSLPAGGSIGDEIVIAAALIVELCEYHYADKHSLLAGNISDSLQEVAPQPNRNAVTRLLQPKELKDNVYLARRVGIIPFGLAQLEPACPSVSISNVSNTLILLA